MAARLTLGRDLNALLGRQSELAAAAAPPPPIPDQAVHQLPVTALSRGRYQPRSVLKEEELDALAASIEQQGVLQPIVVRPLAEAGCYEILAGERRWRAAQKAGLDQVPVIVKSVSDQEALAVALVENIQREDLNPIEEAKALARLAEEFTLTHQEVARLVGKNRSTVSNLLRLLTVEPWIQQKMLDGVLDMGHVRALLTHSPDVQRQAVERIERFGLTVRDIERWLQQQSMSTDGPKQQSHLDWSSEVIRLQRDLSGCLGTPVKIRKIRGSNKGQLTLTFRGEAELIQWLSHLQTAHSEVVES